MTSLFLGVGFCNYVLWAGIPGDLSGNDIVDLHRHDEYVGRDLGAAGRTGKNGESGQRCHGDSRAAARVSAPLPLRHHDGE